MAFTVGFIITIEKKKDDSCDSSVMLILEAVLNARQLSLLTLSKRN